MKIKILKDEYLFSEVGTHICDEKGFAIKASEDTECEVEDSHVERVQALLTVDRANRGLDSNGNVVEPKEAVEEKVELVEKLQDSAAESDLVQEVVEVNETPTVDVLAPVDESTAVSEPVDQPIVEEA